MDQKNAERPEDTVILEFYSKDDGSDQFTVELSSSDFERYQLAAENLGVDFEEFMVQILDSQLQDDATEWLIPTVNTEGDLSFDGATLMDLSHVAESSTEKENE